jgi:FAD/FMN-containing dehydrogenase
MTRNRVQFKVHGGGHSNTHSIASPGVLLDTSHMRTVTVDIAAMTAVVSAGATNSDVYKAVTDKGLITSKSQKLFLGLF